MAMKTLIVYIKDSYYKFPGIFEKHIYTVDDLLLDVYEISKVDGHESLVASFRNWDYFVIEED
jgi:hypothetical protein